MQKRPMRERSSSAEYDDIFEQSGKPKQQNQEKGKTYTVEDGQFLFDLTSNKRVCISQFKGRVMVSVREYYNKDGQMLPTKKGVTLQLDNWEKFKQFIPDIDECINKLKK